MFTGIIEEIGTISHVGRKGQVLLLTVEASKILSDIHLGDSIAINGVCLTVVTFNSRSFTVDVMPETFRSTNLQELRNGSRVNLERAMSAQSRFGGHIVQGHVDGTGIIRSLISDENAMVYRVEPHHTNLLKYILPKGSITIDGISLTVVGVEQTVFSVSIIPHTLGQTILASKKAGDTVNLENDIIGKYVERLLSFQGKEVEDSVKGSRLTANFLAEHGF